jgi:hypothetical protein
MSETIDQYFQTKENLEEYFGYAEDWVQIPWEDYRQYHWFFEKSKDVPVLDGSLAENGKIIYWDSIKAIVQNQEWYRSPLYTQRFLMKWIYHAKDFTMVCLNTQTDGNKHLAIFDNAKAHKALPIELQQAILQLELEFGSMMKK